MDSKKKPSSGSESNMSSDTRSTGAEKMSDLDMDPCDEDQTEIRFLLSKPTCFISIGKPGSGKTSLARRLAHEWKCELVNATDVIMQAVELQTELGQKVQEVLLRGEAIPEELAAKLIEDTGLSNKK